MPSLSIVVLHMKLIICFVEISLDRMIAARARQRTKDTVNGLSDQVAMLTAQNAHLEKARAELESKVLALEEENRLLRNSSLQPYAVSRELLERLHLRTQIGPTFPGSVNTGVMVHPPAGNIAYSNIAIHGQMPQSAMSQGTLYCQASTNVAQRGDTT